MKKFYYTYGTSPTQPFEGGWTEVIAQDRRQADLLFMAMHPCTETSPNTLRCAFVYEGDDFIDTYMYKHGNFGKRCVECIVMQVFHYCGDRIKDDNSEAF